MKTKIEDLTDEQLNFLAWKLSKRKESPEFYRPTTNAAQCDEIQEREKISVNFEFEGCWSADNYNVADNTRDSATHGATAKRAIVSCFVKSELGEEVDCETNLNWRLGGL